MLFKDMDKIIANWESLSLNFGLMTIGWPGMPVKPTPCRYPWASQNTITLQGGLL